MTLRAFKRIEANLKNKWGCESEEINRAFDLTYRALYNKLKDNKELLAKNKYLRDLCDFMRMWDEGIVTHKDQFWMTYEEMIEKYAQPSFGIDSRLLKNIQISSPGNFLELAHQVNVKREDKLKEEIIQLKVERGCPND